MIYKPYTIINKVYAYIPIKTIDEGWVWCKYIYKEINRSPAVYWGLLPHITYYADKENIE